MVESTIDRLKAKKRSKGGGEREPHPSQPNEILKIQEMTFVTICILVVSGKVIKMAQALLFLIFKILF